VVFVLLIVAGGILFCKRKEEMSIVIGVIFALVLGTFLDRFADDRFWKENARRNESFMDNLGSDKNGFGTPRYFWYFEERTWKIADKKSKKKWIILKDFYWH